MRFPGFEGEWNSELFSNLFIFLSNNTLSRAELSDVGNIRNIHYGDILVKYANVINIDEEIIPFVSSVSENKIKCDMLCTGDVIIADTAEDDTVGKATEIINQNNKLVVSGLHTMACRPNRNFIASFLGYYFNSNAYHSQLYPYMQGIKVTSISKMNIGKTMIHFPSNNEQKKIVELFNLIEKKILIQKKLVEYLKLYKRGLLAKLFPQKGDSVPQYRFEGFTDDWEQRKVGDTCKMNGRIGFRGYTEKDIILKENGGILTFSPTNIVDNKLTMDCKNTYITREKYEESPEIMIKNGDILFVKTGSTLGKSALVTGLDEDASINPQIVVMRVKEGTEAFMSNVLVTQSILKQVAAVRIGGAVPTMTETELKNFEYFAPVSDDEKVQIGSFFADLGNLITLHQRKQGTLSKMKSALLQQMFI